MAVLSLDWHQSISGGATGDIHNWGNALTDINAYYTDTSNQTSSNNTHVDIFSYDGKPQNSNGTFTFVINADGEHLVSGSLSATTSARTMISDPVSENLSAVPVPTALWLFGSGLIGLVGFKGR